MQVLVHFVQSYMEDAGLTDGWVVDKLKSVKKWEDATAFLDQYFSGFSGFSGFSSWDRAMIGLYDKLFRGMVPLVMNLVKERGALLGGLLRTPEHTLRVYEHMMLHSSQCVQRDVAYKWCILLHRLWLNIMYSPYDFVDGIIVDVYSSMKEENAVFMDCVILSDELASS